MCLTLYSMIQLIRGNKLYNSLINIKLPMIAILRGVKFNIQTCDS